MMRYACCATCRRYPRPLRLSCRRRAAEPLKRQPFGVYPAGMRAGTRAPGVSLTGRGSIRSVVCQGELKSWGLGDYSAADRDNRGVSSVCRAQLLDDVLHVILHGVRLDDQAQRNLSIGQSVDQQLEHLLLAARQRCQEIDVRRRSATRLAKQLVDQLFETLILALQLVQHLDAINQNGRLICQELEQTRGLLIHTRRARFTTGVQYTYEPTAQGQWHDNRGRELAWVIRA